MTYRLRAEVTVSDGYGSKTTVDEYEQEADSSEEAIDSLEREIYLQHTVMSVHAEVIDEV